MSRIGRKPVSIPAGVQVEIRDRVISVEGPRGKIAWQHRPEVEVRLDQAAKRILVSVGADNRQTRAYHGLTRSLIQNMVTGVTEGYEKRLEIVGVGYLSAVQHGRLELRVGYAKEVHKQIPEGLEVSCPDQTHILIRGVDKQQVGQFAAEVRSIRLPEPYKGKGIRYQGEHVRIKPGKAAT